MVGYLYVLRSEGTGRPYLGSTSKLRRRLKEHNSGSVRSTSGRGPWSLETYIKFATIESAREAESFMKSKKSKKCIEQLCDGSFIWPDPHIANMI